LKQVRSQYWKHGSLHHCRFVEEKDGVRTLNVSDDRGKLPSDHILQSDFLFCALNRQINLDEIRCQTLVVLVSPTIHMPYTDFVLSKSNSYPSSQASFLCFRIGTLNLLSYDIRKLIGSLTNTHCLDPVMYFQVPNHEVTQVGNRNNLTSKTAHYLFSVSQG
ncbi:hypothetical protein X801_02963, partial [Opisthorchis viverrini]